MTNQDKTPMTKKELKPVAWAWVYITPHVTNDEKLANELMKDGADVTPLLDNNEVQARIQELEANRVVCAAGCRERKELMEAKERISELEAHVERLRGAIKILSRQMVAEISKHNGYMIQSDNNHANQHKQE